MRQARGRINCSLLVCLLLFAVKSEEGWGAGRTLSAAELGDLFQRASAGRAGRARKTKPVDARHARPGETITTKILGEGVETLSPPAADGDMVVRNRCPQTGNEEWLVPKSKFGLKYEGPSSEGDGVWKEYLPKGAPMEFVLVPAEAGEFEFTAPWGELMRARPGDALVRDPANPRDLYRVQRSSFACTYEIMEMPGQ